MIKSLSVFFPAYNEEANIQSVVVKAVKVLKKYSFKWEIIIVDDGSTDNTLEVARKISREIPEVWVVHQKNGGYGKALRAGFGSGKYEWLVYTDADGQLDFGDLDKFLEKTSDFKAVFGYRLTRKDGFLRKVTGELWRLSTKVLLNIDLRDVNCGFKMIKKSVYKSILPLHSTRGAMINPELAVKLTRKGYKIEEVSVEHFPRRAGKASGVSLPVIVSSYQELLKLKWQ